MSKIKDVLAKLDPANDAHWTNDGLPRLDVISKALGRDVTREQLNESSPGFSRAAAAEAGAAALAKAQDGVAPSTPPVPDDELPPAPPKFVAEADTVVSIDELRAELSELISARSNLDVEINRVQNLLAEEQGKADDSGFADTIAMYKASQAAEREKRAALNVQLRESGVHNLIKAAQPAPIDMAARSRRQQY